jgi:hypothetical protein
MVYKCTFTDCNFITRKAPIKKTEFLLGNVKGTNDIHVISVLLQVGSNKLFDNFNTKK